MLVTPGRIPLPGGVPLWLTPLNFQKPALSQSLYFIGPLNEREPLLETLVGGGLQDPPDARTMTTFLSHQAVPLQTQPLRGARRVRPSDKNGRPNRSGPKLWVAGHSRLFITQSGWAGIWVSLKNS